MEFYISFKSKIILRMLVIGEYFNYTLRKYLFDKTRKECGDASKF